MLGAILLYAYSIYAVTLITGVGYTMYKEHNPIENKPEVQMVPLKLKKV